MSENEESYSTYVDYIETNSEIYSLFGGFVFTAITILLTLLPDPSEIGMQTILLFLAVLLNLIRFTLHGNERLLAYCVRVAPQLPEGYRSDVVAKLGNSVYYLFVGIVVLMFFAWSLIYLAIATAIVSVLFIILGHILYRPFTEHYRKYGWAKRTKVRNQATGEQPYSA